MANALPEARQCPTRSDGAHSLIAHAITKAQCSKRQRGRYHKCAWCLHASESVSVEQRKAIARGLLEPTRPVRREPASVPLVPPRGPAVVIPAATG